MLYLEKKVDVLTTLLLENNKISAKTETGLSIKKTRAYDTNLLIELVNNAFFAPGTSLTIYTKITSKTTDNDYFASSVNVKCNTSGLFPRRPLILTTVYMEKPGNYPDMQLSVVVQDRIKNNFYFLSDTII